MSYNFLRDAPANNLSTLANGQVLSASTLNEASKCMNYLAGRGAVINTASGSRISGRIQLPLGVVSRGAITGSGQPTFGDTFLLSTKAIAVPLWLPPGYNMLGMFLEVRLSQLKFSTLRNRYVGSTIAIELVRGGIAYPIVTLTWQNLTGNPLQVGFYQINQRITSLFQSSPIHSEEIHVRLTYDSTEGDTDLLGQFPDGTITYPEFWQGMSYFSVAAYKEENC